MALEPLTQTPPTTQTLAPQPGFDYDLAIVGGGIVGSTLAGALKNLGGGTGGAIAKRIFGASGIG